MNGVALLVAMATVGVDYSWRTTEEGQLEYTIQIEPEFLKALAEGEEIHSDVPPEAGDVQRVCVRIGTTPVRHTAATIQRFKSLWATAGRYASTDPALVGGDTETTILWPARGNPEQSFAVNYGWQPDQEGHQAYYVQVDPTVLKTLAAGDEIYASIDPTAGRVARFVVAAGSKQLPRIGSPASEITPQGAPPVASTQPPSSGRSRFTTSDTPSPATSGSTSGRTRTGEFGPQPSTAPPLTGNASGTTGTGGYSSRFNTEPSPASGDLRGQTYDQSPTYGPSNGQLVEAPRNGYREPPVLDRTGDRYQQPLNTPADGGAYNQQPQVGSGRFNEPRGSLQPPVDYGAVAAPPPSYVQPAGNQQPQYAPQQYQQQPTTSFSPPLNSNDRLAALQPPTSTAATAPPQTIPPALSSATATSTDGNGSAPTGMMWLMLMFALFLSIGGNAYLAWTAAEFYSRYRTAVDRLRSAART